MAYVTLEEFKAAVSIDDAASDANLQRALDAATEWIDTYTGRTFSSVDVTPTSRTFDPFEDDRISVPDLTSVETLAVDTDLDGSFATILETDEYQLYPLNALEPGGSPGGYTEIRLRPDASLVFQHGQYVRVTALWGYGETPASIEQACIILANRYFHRPSAPFGQWEGPQTGTLGTVPEQDPDVVMLLQAYTTGAGTANAATGSTWVLV